MPKLQILHRYTKAVLYEGEYATLKDCLMAAVRSRADLSYANLSRADLSYANLSGADLSRADLSYANLSRADLSDANLSDANLSYANLSRADLSYANLSDANLSRADLSRADLSYANLSRADLSYANLSGADLSYANLSGADLSRADLSRAKNTALALARTVITPEGTLIGWKKCKGNVLVKLEIPAKARRSCASGRKCRAEYVKVLQVIGAKIGVSAHDNGTKYVKGKTVRCDEWCEDRWKECAGGIHFFLTREEAEAYF